MRSSVTGFQAVWVYRTECSKIVVKLRFLRFSLWVMSPAFLQFTTDDSSTNFESCCYWPWVVFIYLHSVSVAFLESFCWQFPSIMQVFTNVFITAIDSLGCVTSLVVVTEGLATQDSLPWICHVSCYVVVFCHLGCYKEVLSLSLPTYRQVVFLKKESVICFKKPMCEKSVSLFLSLFGKGFSVLEGIENSSIHPAGIFTNYPIHISNFASVWCHNWVCKHMLHVFSAPPFPLYFF